ncbi:unnamed protein product [marine sediment metagenome]|uniref:EF-hand domain-containing protein n=1 Tax=marine sediment metagenome TaxID=412755 RepID=X0RYU7_9ZZZZ
MPRRIPSSDSPIWWSNDDQDGDPFDIDISNDDGATWIPALTFSDIGYPIESWSAQDIDIAAAIAPEPVTAAMRFRFSVADPVGSASVDEAGVDAVKIFQVDCGQTFSPCDLNEDGALDLDDYAIFADCLAGPDVTDPPGGCAGEYFLRADLDPDGDVDLRDFNVCSANLAAGQ